ncbi:MAG: hypothetical protein AAGA18_12580 [Verrucomicrobiota bacterium]
MNFKDKSLSVWQEKQFIVFLCVLAGVFIFQNLGEAPLGYFDELKSAERSTSFLTTGDWGAVHMNHEANFNKPPLQYWLNALFYLGQTDKELAVRWVNGFFCLALFIILPFWVKIYCPNVRWLSALSVYLLLVYGPFLEYARIGILDMGAAFFCILTWVLIGLACRDVRWWAGVALVCVLGALQKTPLPFAIWLFCLLGFGFNRTERVRLHNIWLWGSLLFALLLASVWPTLQIIRFGNAYFDTYIKYELSEMVRRDFNYGPFTYIWWMSKKWFLFAGLALVGNLWILLAKEFRKEKVLWLSALWVFLFFLGMSSLTGHSHRYLFPILPIMAVFAAWTWIKLLGNRPMLSVILLLLSSIPCWITAHYHYHLKREEYAPYVELWRELGEELKATKYNEGIFISMSFKEDSGALNPYGMMLGSRYYGAISEKVIELDTAEDFHQLDSMNKPLLGIVARSRLQALNDLSLPIEVLVEVEEAILLRIN